MDPLIESKTDNQVCTESCCSVGDNERKIKCTKCKRFVHFACTNLPMYQLQLFFTKNYRGFTCVNCVKVTEELEELFKDQQKTMIDTFRREIDACENIIIVQKENESKLINGIKKLKENQKKDTQEKEILVDLIEKKFNHLEEKLSHKLEESVKKATANKTTGESFASVVKENKKELIVPDFGKIIRDEKLKEIEEEHQHDLRQSNIMIFGKKEENEVQDDQFVENLIKDVGIDSSVKFMTRIGEPGKKIRPIKVVLESSHDRYLLMKGLVNLKGKLSYEGISITEDFTIFERSIIKEWANKAKERNEREPKDSKFVWRVRGTPSKSLYLKKTEKKDTEKAKNNKNNTKSNTKI